MSFIEALKIIFLGVIEGITEWLPVSSTGHMLLVDQFLTLNFSAEFKETFFIVIQLGAILAVCVLFFKQMLPLEIKPKTKPLWKKDVLSLWLKVIVACIPGAIVTLALDDFIDAHLHTPYVIASALIFYGILFIIIEKLNAKKTPKINGLNEISYKTALLIGLFQVLSIIPGTSRSGATIIGALILGVSRTSAAEFTFYLAVPVMIGYSLLKILKFVLAGLSFTLVETLALLLGMLVAFLVSLVVIKFLLSYIKKKDFTVFGVYRILLGIAVLGYFIFI